MQIKYCPAWRSQQVRSAPFSYIRFPVQSHITAKIIDQHLPGENDEERFGFRLSSMKMRGGGHK